MFKGIYKGKVINISTNALLWQGEYLGIDDNYVILSKATARSISSGIEIIPNPQVFVNIPLDKILSVSAGISAVNNVRDIKSEGIKNQKELFPIINYYSSIVTINKQTHYGNVTNLRNATLSFRNL